MMNFYSKQNREWTLVSVLCDACPNHWGFDRSRGFFNSLKWGNTASAVSRSCQSCQSCSKFLKELESWLHIAKIWHDFLLINHHSFMINRHIFSAHPIRVPPNGTSSSSSSVSTVGTIAALGTSNSCPPDHLGELDRVARSIGRRKSARHCTWPSKDDLQCSGSDGPPPSRAKPSRHPDPFYNSHQPRCVDTAFRGQWSSSWVVTLPGGICTEHCVMWHFFGRALPFLTFCCLTQPL